MSSVYLKDCEKDLAEKYIALLHDFRENHPGYDLQITCTHRSAKEQMELYAIGRSKPGQIVTQIDGVKKMSNHNFMPSRALDVAVLIHGKITWDEEAYKPLVALAEKHGLVSGGSWKTFKDYPHLELP